MLDRLKQRYREIRLEPMDHVTIGYLAVTGVLMIPFHHQVPNWELHVLIRLPIILLIVEIIRFSNRNQKNWMDALRTFYPVLGMPFAWKEVGEIVTMIFPFWGSGLIAGMDLRFFGVHPTLWVENHFNPWLTELMNFFYSIYYLFIPAIGLTLFFKGQRRQAREFIFFTTLTFATCYLLFILMPTEGAWTMLGHLHTREPKGGLFLWINRTIQSKGGICGAAFPSSHVAAAWVILFSVRRYLKPWFWALFPLVLGVTCATVYCRYHHAVDSLAGIVTGILIFSAGSAWLKFRGHSSEIPTIPSR